MELRWLAVGPGRDRPSEIDTCTSGAAGSSVTSAGEVGSSYWRQHDRNICMDRIEVPCGVLHKESRPVTHTINNGQLQQASGFPQCRAARGLHNAGSWPLHIYICICARARVYVCACYICMSLPYIYEPRPHVYTYVHPRHGHSRDPRPVF